MHISVNRIAVIFWQPQNYEQIIKVVDLNGRTVATHYEPAAKDGEQPLGLGFACYTQNPERFTFLETTDDNRLALITATPEEVARHTMSSGGPGCSLRKPERC